MKATIKTIDPDGVAVDFETKEMGLEALLNLVPQIKQALVEAGYELVDTYPAQTVNVTPAASAAPTFAVEKIVATVDAESGKIYWRVKGSEFQKFGVIIYPEILEAAGLADLNPLKPFTEPGWVAHYSLKENGKPKKVLRLERHS